MNFEPQKFFIGLVDFFSIFMPGALAVYVGKDWAVQQIGESVEFKLDGPEAAAVFLFASYLVGHFIFLIGARVLDDYVYDPLRNATTRRQVERLAKGKYLSFRLVRWLARRRLFFGRNGDEALQVAMFMKSRYFEGTSGADAINAFQWSKALLSKEHPEGLAQVHRFEADSKFFRSFVVVLSVLTVVFAVQAKFPWAAVCVGLVFLSLWRYVEQRFKASQQAYWHVITLRDETLNAPARDDELTHAGGVVWNNDEKDTKYLLVTAKRNPKQWVLPKGHIEPGEALEETAIREVKEETLRWPLISTPMGNYFLGPENTVYTRLFLMTVLQEPITWKRRRWRRKRNENVGTDEDRRRKWFTLEGAKAELKDESKLVLDCAAKLIEKSNRGLTTRSGNDPCRHPA